MAAAIFLNLRNKKQHNLPICINEEKRSDGYSSLYLAYFVNEKKVYYSNARDTKVYPENVVIVSLVTSEVLSELIYLTDVIRESSPTVPKFYKTTRFPPFIRLIIALT